MQGHAHAIKGPPVTQPHHSSKCSKMARTYPLTVSYNECLGRKANPLSFASLRLIDLRNGHSQYVSIIEQLVDALPKSMDPASSFALQGHIARPRQTRLRHSMRAAIWFLLLSDGAFRQSSSSLQYFLTRQRRRVDLRGGDVTPPPWERHLNWIHEDHPLPSRDHSKENLPPPEEPRKLPKKMMPCRKPRKHHHHHLSQTGSQPGTSQSPSSAMSTPVSIPGPSSAHSLPSLPAQRPIIIQNGLISWTRLNLAAYLNRPDPASARNSPLDLVETTSPGLISPSLACSDLIETTSLGRPLGS